MLKVDHIRVVQNKAAIEKFSRLNTYFGKNISKTFCKTIF